MIKTRQDLKEYIIADRSRYNFRSNWIINKIMPSEKHQVFSYLKCLNFSLNFTDNVNYNKFNQFKNLNISITVLIILVF